MVFFSFFIFCSCYIFLVGWVALFLSENAFYYNANIPFDMAMEWYDADVVVVVSSASISFVYRLLHGNLTICYTPMYLKWKKRWKKKQFTTTRSLLLLHTNRLEGNAIENYFGNSAHTVAFHIFPSLSLPIVCMSAFMRWFHFFFFAFICCWFIFFCVWIII